MKFLRDNAFYNERRISDSGNDVCSDTEESVREVTRLIK